MPSYTSLLRFVEPANGDVNWGTTVNTGFTALADAAIAGKADIDVTAGNVTLTIANGAADEARRMVINITGTPGAAREVLVPSTSKIYFVRNGANAAVTVKVSGQTGVSVPVNASMILRVNGTDAVQAIDTLGNLTATGDLSVSGNATITGTTLADGSLTVTANAQTTPVVVTFSATAMTVDCALSNVFTTTFTANVTVAPTISNPADGQTINWFITQDGTGGRTMTWPTSFKWPLAAVTTLSTTGNAVDLVTATYRSATGHWYASLLKGFS